MEGLYHVWFSTKGRRQALEGELGGDVRQLLFQTAERADIHLLDIEAVADHVHLLIELPGTQTLSSAMHRLKGATSRHIFLKYPELKVDLAHNSFWQKGYGWRKIDPAEAPAVKHYIQTQRNRPLRHAS